MQTPTVVYGSRCCRVTMWYSAYRQRGMQASFWQRWALRELGRGKGGHVTKWPVLMLISWYRADSRFMPGQWKTSLPWQIVRHFTGYVFRCIFVNEKFCILIWMSLKFVLKGPIGIKQSLVYVIARCLTGDKPLSQPMLTRFTNAYMQH